MNEVETYQWPAAHCEQGIAFHLVVHQGEMMGPKKYVGRLMEAKWQPKVIAGFNLVPFFIPHGSRALSSLTEDFRKGTGEIPGNRKEEKHTSRPSAIGSVYQINGYQIEITSGLLNVKTGSPIVQELFTKLGEVPYSSQQKWVPGVFVEATYAHSLYSAVLAITPAIPFGPLDDAHKLRIIAYPWQQLASDHQDLCAG